MPRRFAILIAAVWVIALPVLAHDLGNVPGPSLHRPLQHAQPTPFPRLAPRPQPSLPPWIVQISPNGPKGEWLEPNSTVAQVRVRFKEPLIALEAIESTDLQRKLSFFHLTPNVPGHFRFMTPRLVAFEPERELPLATRFHVTIDKGLTSLEGKRLDRDVRWSFETAPIIINLPYGSGFDLKPDLTLSSSVELDLNFLRRHFGFFLSENGGNTAIPVKLSVRTRGYHWKPEPDNYDPQQQNYQDWTYGIGLDQPLKKSTAYSLSVAAGAMPAWGNLPLSAPVTSDIRTYDPLAFQGVGQSEGGEHLFDTGDPSLEFNNALAPESARTHIHISGVDSTALSDGSGGSIGITPLALRPATTYKVTIDSDLTDHWGQTLGHTIKTSFFNGDYTADFWAPVGLHTIPAQSDLRIGMAAINLPTASYGAAYTVMKPLDVVYFNSAEPSQSDPRQIFSAGLVPLKNRWQNYRVSIVKNQPVDIMQPTRELLGPSGLGMLAYGVTAQTYRYRDYQNHWQLAVADYYGLVQITNLGVFAQVQPDAAVVRVHRLSDGLPVVGASVALYTRDLKARIRPTRVACATGSTDASGVAFFHADSCRPPQEAGSQGPDLVAIVRSGDDWAFTSFPSGYANLAGLWWSDWDWGSVSSRGAIFSDRFLYQPGETATFTGAAFYLQHDEIRRDAGGRYKISITDPQGATTNEGTRTADAFGLFSTMVGLNRSQRPGYYRIAAEGNNGNKFEGNFQVAEFKPPVFKIDLSVDKDTAVGGETEIARAAGTYLFGSPLTGGSATWFVNRDRWYPRYSPWSPQWDGYAFGKAWIEPEVAPTVSPDVLKATGAFDQSGNTMQHIGVEKRLPFWMAYTVELEASDAANRSVAQSTSFLVLPSSEVIGIATGRSPIKTKQPASVRVVVTDRHAKALAGRNVALELQLRHLSPNNTVSYETVARTSVQSATNAVTALLSPPEAGTYRVRADFAGANDNAAETDGALVAVTDLPSPTPSPVAAPTEPPIDVTFSIPSPKPGDTEHLRVTLPYNDADVYIAVLRHKIYQQTSAHVVGGLTDFTFAVIPDMAPDVFVEVQAVRRGTPRNGVTAAAGQTLSQVRFFGLQLDISDRKLQATVTAMKPRMQPGGNQTLHFRLRDAAGHPAKGEFVVAVADDSVLRLTGYRPANLFDRVWNGIPASLIASDNRDDVLRSALQPRLLSRYGYGRPPGEQEFSVSRSVSADVYTVNTVNAVKTIGRITMVRGTASTVDGNNRIVVRSNFDVLAYYNGAVRTDDAGYADVSFTVPDSLTTWRVMAQAVGAPNPGPGSPDLRFGYAETTFITHKPLAITPLLPQFVRPSDRMNIGVNLTNDTASSGTVALRGLLQGPLAFTSDSRHARELSSTAYAGPGTTGHRFGARATGWGTGLVEFTAILGDNNDAFRVPLPVLPLEVTEHVVETGTTTRNIDIPINVDPHVDPRVGGLNVTLASSLLPQITVPAGQVLDGLDIPLLEPSASRLSIAADLRALDLKFKRPVSRFDPMRVAADQLDHLVELQNDDGGFSYWPGDTRSDPWDSAYAAEALGHAVTTGIRVDPAMISPLRAYLDQVVDNPRNFLPPWVDEACAQRLRLDAMIGLHNIGEQRTDRLVDVYAYRELFGLVGQTKLARMLSTTPGWSTQAKAATAKLQEIIYETGRYATADVPEGWWWYDSVTCAQSQMLRLFVLQRIDPEILDKVLRGLVARQRNGAWLNQYDTAQALRAIVDYAQLEPLPPNFTATAMLAGRQIDAVKFMGYEKTTEQVNVPMAQLPRNRSDLVLAKAGTGRLHYVVEYGYRVKGTEKGNVNGFRLERTVTEANQRAVLAHVQLLPPANPAMFGVAKVYDVALHVIVDHPVDRVIVTDPLPAGLEAVNESFATTTRHYQIGGWNWGFNYQTIYRDRVVLYADKLWPGSYFAHYLVRSVTPGLYLWPGASAYLLYAPEEFGRTASSTLVIKDR